MSSSPIFIIGTERSGTNLLRLILNSHPEVAVPHPPHIVKLFTPLLHLYGDLLDDRNFTRLIADVCRLVELHTYPWDIMLDRKQVFNEAAARELICIYFAVYDQYLELSGKKRWCCKSTFMIDHLADILRFQPDARFIFMVRDGRDVAVSAKASIFNHYHVFYSAKRWQREQRIGIEWLNKLSPAQILLLRYEDLINAPEKKVAELCDFLALPYDAGMLEYHRMGEAKKSGGLSVSWENTSKPVMSENSEKFRTSLSDNEIRLFEAIAGNELVELGYSTVNSAEYLLQMKPELNRERIVFKLGEFSMKIKTELRHLFRDKNSAARMKKNFYMTYLAHTRKLTRHLS